MKEIKEKELLPLDDEFAKDVSEFNTLDELKEDIKKKKTEEAEHRALHEFEDNVIKKVVENAEVDIPQVMVDNQVESMIRDFDYQLRYQGLDLDSYMKNCINPIRKQHWTESRLSLYWKRLQRQRAYQFQRKSLKQKL